MTFIYIIYDKTPKIENTYYFLGKISINSKAIIDHVKF